MPRSAFDVESEERLDSPEKLGEYIRVANPGMLVMAAALVLVVAALLVWGTIGRIPESVPFKGVVDGSMGYTIDVVVDAKEYSGEALVGKEARFTFADGTKGVGVVSSTVKVPLSRQEMEEILESDFLSASLIESDYSYIVFITPGVDLSKYDLQLVDLTIITREVRPIEYLLR